MNNTDHHGLIMKVEAKLDALVKNVLRLIGGVHVDVLPRDKMLLVVVDRRVNHTITNRLS